MLRHTTSCRRKAPRERSQTLVTWGLMQKFKSRFFFCSPPPSDLKKVSGPPFFHENYGSTPLEKHVNIIFTGKFVVIFFKALLQGSKILSAPLFASAPPPTSVCEWSPISTMREICRDAIVRSYQVLVRYLLLDNILKCSFWLNLMPNVIDNIQMQKKEKLKNSFWKWKSLFLVKHA